MRSIALVAVLTLMTPASAHGRLFWQTYGATVAAPGDGGAGCAWNMNQDYFVPRHCDTGRYGLFSACKTAHSISPACKSLHPVYAGYCTPYGSWHYKRRDHVYKKYCGCTPWSHVYGKWHLDRCCKPMCLPLHGNGCGQGCSSEPACDAGAWYGGIETQHPLCLCNVEPIGGETLGSIAALASGAVLSSGSAVPAPTANTPATLPPKLNLTPTAGAGGSGGLPAPFND
jgi:hypothetical protein